MIARAAAFAALLALPAGGALAQDNPPRVLCDGAPVQGGFLICTATPPSDPPLSFNGGIPEPIEDTGYAFFGIGRDDTGTIEVRGHGLEPYTAQIAAREFDIQRIDGLPPSKVQPRTAEEQAKVEADWLKKQEAWENRAEGAWWMDGFLYPLEKDVIQSGVYGSQRVLNGEPNNPHQGIDFAAQTGDAILAPAGGQIVLAEPDMYFEGGLVVIDHGHGVMGVFMHMSQIDVSAGELVAPGQKIGEVGASGRATGPHLHWGLRVRGTYIDPELVMDFDPSASKILTVSAE